MRCLPPEFIDAGDLKEVTKLNAKTTRISGTTDCGDAGLGLVEIMIALFLLAILAISFLPVLIQGLQLSVRNATLSTASQLLNEELDRLSALDGTCAALAAHLAATPASTTDARGTVYQPRRQLAGSATCVEGTAPSTVQVDLSIDISGATTPDPSITTLYYVNGTTP